MTPILATVVRLPARAFGTVVVVGAGDDLDLRPFGAQPPRRLVLVEGDRQASQALEAALRTQPGVELQPVVVAPAAGRGPWQACNLRGLAAPAIPDGLQRLFPRLRVEAPREVEAVALAGLLQGLRVVREPGLANVLVLDVPGQEAALLGSLPETGWLPFDYVLWRGLALPGAEPAAFEAPPFCQPLALPVDEGPLWPLRAVRVDARAQELRAVRGRLQVAEQQAQALATELARAQGAARDAGDEARAARAAADEARAGHEAAIAALQGDLQRLHDAVSAGRDALQAERQRGEAWRLERDAARVEADERAAAIERLQAAAMAAATAAAAEAQALQAARTEAGQAHEQLRAAQARALERAEADARALDAEREAASRAAAEQAARQQHQQAELDRLRATLAGAITDRDAQRAARQQAEARLAALQREFADHGLRIETLEAELADVRSLAQAADERLRAECDALQAALTHQVAETDALRQARADDAAAATSAATRAAEAAQAADKERQALNKRLAQQSEAALAAELRADAAEARLRRLDQQLVEMGQRQARLDEELLRAEGQLALVARLTLGDAGL